MAESDNILTKMHDLMLYVIPQLNGVPGFSFRQQPAWGARRALFLSLWVAFLSLGSVMAHADGVAYADSGNFILDTTGTAPGIGGVAYADSANFTLDTTGTTPGAGGVAWADSGDFTLNTAAPCVPAPSGLVGWWRAEYNANDSIGTNHGVLVNGTTFVAGKAGQAFSFDGIDDYVSIPHASGLNAYPLTVAAWIKTTQTGNDAGLVNKYLASSLNGWQLYIWNGEARAWYFRNGSSYVWDGDRGLDAGPVNDGLWHHVAFTVDAGGGKIYVDGLLKQSLPWTGTAGAPTTTQELRLGDHAGSVLTRYYSGLLDEVSIFNRGLTQSELQAIYNAGVAGMCPNGSGGTPPVIRKLSLVGTNFVMAGTNGPAGATYYVLTSTNVALPVTNWSRLATNVFDANGSFNFTNAIAPNIPQRFYVLRLP